MSNNRKNCPGCGRINSVRILSQNNKTVEHCFGVDCNYYKADKKEFEIGSIATPTKKVLDINNLMEARSHPDSLAFLHKYHCGEVSNKIYYYPKGNRIVFNYKDLYVGRALDKTVQPKWYVYTDSEHPFIARRYTTTHTKSVILVEDCVSACNASRLIDSIALLGTTVKDSYLADILKYDTIYVALDEDATTKALKIQRVLSLVKDCIVVPLKKDIKYMGLDELEELLNLHGS